MTANNRYLIGIDLGTSNSALFYLDREDLTYTTRHFPILQQIDEQQLLEKPALPSHLFIALTHETDQFPNALPWGGSTGRLCGEWAKQLISKRPGQVVHSAKSWLACGNLDPQSAFLPQSDLQELNRLSPVDASVAFLEHLKSAWNYRFAQNNPEYRLEEQSVVVTVPASFDEMARELTVEAIQSAGFKHFTLLEEPQAAFYAWLALQQTAAEAAQSGSAQSLADIQRDIILVVDVGGGTSDFSLFERTVEKVAGQRAPKIQFKRLAVSDHILLGGDNMDLALAAQVESQLTQGKKKLTPRLWDTLVHQCRQAKEELLSGLYESRPLTVARSGSQLMGAVHKTTLARDTVCSVILDGFFPQVAWDEARVAHQAQGLREMGLPYAREPAVTRHLGQFLKRAIQENPTAVSFPDKVLFNGGSLAPELIRERLLQQLEQWQKEWSSSQGLPKPASVQVLVNHNLHLAVAQGAAYYHLARLGLTLKIEGGSARSYYLQVGGQEKETTHWVCILPHQAPTELVYRLSQQTFHLKINTLAQFPLISSVHRPHDEAGAILSLTAQQLAEQFVQLPPVQTTAVMDKNQLKRGADTVPVELEAMLNEVGILRLVCVNAKFNESWQLNFRIRQSGAGTSSANQSPLSETDELELPQSWRQAHELVRGLYARKTKAPVKEESKPFSIYRMVEDVLETPRKDWSLPLLRSFWPVLHAGATRRVRSVQHELNWLKLTGYCLRPGTGHLQDEIRMRQASDLIRQGAIFKEDRAVQLEFQVMCRRLAQGIPADLQNELYQSLRSLLFQPPSKPKQPSKSAKGKKSPAKKTESGSLNELWRLFCSLEHLPASEKAYLGRLLIDQVKQNKTTGIEGWCLARLGNRVPIYGAAVNVVQAATVETWIEWLLSLKNSPFAQDLPNILVQLARFTDDRQRDIDDLLRDRVMTHLKQHPDTTDLQTRLVTPPHSQHASTPDGKGNDWLYGEALPVGLSLE